MEGRVEGAKRPDDGPGQRAISFLRMGISFNIPPSIEQALARSGCDPSLELKEAALVELYRLGRISHGQLAEGLGLSRFEADALLRRHNVTEDLPTRNEVSEQLRELRKRVG
jgi:predicted HTH domain antitoxin